MAQKLKDTLRQQIIISSIALMKAKGISNVDMRSIAKDTGMTVGNLYRYFKNKEDLISTIIQPMIEEIETIISKQSQGLVSLQNNQMSYHYLNKLTLKQQVVKINQLIVDVIVQLHNLAHKNPDITEILLHNNEFLVRIEEWINTALLAFFYQHYQLTTNENYSFQIILQSQIKSFVVGLNYFLQASCDVQQQAFIPMSEFYIQQNTQIFQSMLQRQLDLKTIIVKESNYE